MIRRLAICVLAVVAIMGATNVVCAAQPQFLLTSHVREVTTNGQAPFVGRLPATQSMQVDIVLPMRDQAGLDRFLQEVYDSSSPTYRHFLSVDQFTQMFGPTQQDYDAVIRFAKANGFTVAGGSRDGMDVQLKGSVATIEAAFHITMVLYHDPIEDRDFYAPDREPTVDLAFQLWHISGLDNYSLPRPELVRRPSGSLPPATTGSCPQQSFCGSDMRAAYYEGAALTGKGQNIGLFEFAGFDIADVNTYYKNAKQKRTAEVKGISTDGTQLQCFYSQGCDDTEQTLDITQAIGMAPGVTAVYMYVGSTDTAILASMTSHKPLPLQLSSSWQWSSSPATDDPYFKKMAAQGQSFFKGSGDQGAWGNESCAGEYPRDDAYVTVVGGTDLITKGPGKGWASETGWVDGGGGYCPADGIKIPSWQKLKGVITKANQGSTIYRNGPDVSANANFTFYVCADQDGCTANEYGGVSFSTPMWAGYIALANEEAAAKGKKPLGFINPSMYRLGVGSGYKSDFHDITSGGNGNPPTKGYDLTSGWGTPNGDGLIDALVK